MRERYKPGATFVSGVRSFFLVRPAPQRNVSKYRANYSSSFHVISHICSGVGPSRQPLTSFWNYMARKRVCSIPTFVPLGMKGTGLSE